VPLPSDQRSFSVSFPFPSDSTRLPLSIQNPSPVIANVLPPLSIDERRILETFKSLRGVTNSHRQVVRPSVLEEALRPRARVQGRHLFSSRRAPDNPFPARESQPPPPRSGSNLPIASRIAPVFLYAPLRGHRISGCQIPRRGMIQGGAGRGIAKGRSPEQFPGARRPVRSPGTRRVQGKSTEAAVQRERRQTPRLFEYETRDTQNTITLRNNAVHTLNGTYAARR